jgi:integral membrane protein (TIGR01906 family)
MSGRRFFNALAGIAVTLATALILLLGNLYILATPAFVRLEYSQPDLPTPAEFSEAERLRYAEATLTYLRTTRRIQWLQDIEHNGQPLYNSRELAHLVDVKNAMYVTTVVFWIAVAVFVVSAIYILSQPGLRQRLPIYVFRGALLLVILIVLIGAFAWLSFMDFFFLFHRLLFTGDSWLFFPDDSLILLFPLGFWIDAAAAWLILALGEAILVGSAMYLWPGWSHKRKAF